MDKNITAQLKGNLKAGKKVFGCLIGTGNDPESTLQAVKEFGYDFVIVDCEHSLVGKETINAYIRAAKERNLSIWVRPEHKTATVGFMVDSGVCGLMVPQVDTAQDAGHMVHQAYFPPLGHRGCGNWGNPYLVDGQEAANLPFLSVTEYLNNNMALFPQIEKLQAVENLEAILKVDGVTGCIVGTFDLALDIGGIDPKAPRQQIIKTDIMESKLKHIAVLCRKIGKAAGIGGILPKDCARWGREGYQIFLLGYVMYGNVEKLRPLISEGKANIPTS